MIPCFYSAETEAHAPEFFLLRGVPAANEEQAGRAVRLLSGLQASGLKPVEPARYSRSEYERVHTARYLDFLETAWTEWQKLPDPGPEVVPNIHPEGPVRHYPDGIVGRAGWHMADTACPIGRDTYRAAIRAADTALAAADAVLGGARSAYALCRPPGHHAYADTAGGHCILNNAAIATEHLRTMHDRVALLDIDVHHGNGTQGIFWQRGDVLNVSIHADPSAFYPFYCGYEDETGEGDGAGANLNLPLARGSDDTVWLEAIKIALRRIADYDPGALVLSLGLDAHEHDPLGGLAVTTPAFEQAARLIAGANLPTVIVQEGGYLSDHLTRNLTAFLDGWQKATTANGENP